MPAFGNARRRAVVTAVLAGACLALAGCGGSNSSSGSAAGGPNIPLSSASPASAGGTSGSAGKLTGNFCTDFKNLGTNIKVPADAQGSLSALQQHGAPYLSEAAAYFNGLAGEASPQAGKELRIIAADYQALAASIASGNLSSLSEVEQQMASLATKGTSGTAFRQLLAYMLTKCGVSA
jgi:hypothetical protein